MTAGYDNTFILIVGSFNVKEKKLENALEVHILCLVHGLRAGEQELEPG